MQLAVNLSRLFVFPFEVVESEQEQPEIRVASEFQHVSSDDSTAQSEDSDSDEDWVLSRGAQATSKKQKVKASRHAGLKQRREGMLPDGESPAPRQKDRRLCPLCGKGFQYICPLTNHVKTHQMTSDAMKELLNSLQSAHNQRLVCDVRGKKCISLSCLQMHLKMHKGIKDFKCQECGKTFVGKEHLMVHERTHSGVRPYHCDVRGKAFSQSQNLRAHRRERGRTVVAHGTKEGSRLHVRTKNEKTQIMVMFFFLLHITAYMHH